MFPKFTSLIKNKEKLKTMSDTQTTENIPYKKSLFLGLYGEEVGINLEKLTSFGIYKNSSVNKNAIVHCFYAKTDNPKFQIDKTEIGEAEWFEWEHLPQPLSIDTARIIEMFNCKN